MEDRRLLIAFLLSVAVFAVWQVLAPHPAPRPPAAGAPAAQTTPAKTASPSPTPTPAVTPAEGAESTPAEEEPISPPVAGSEVSAASEQRVVLESERARAVFTNRGAQLVSLQLKQHRTEGGGVLDLVRARAGGPYPFAVVDGEGRPSALDGALFAVETDGKHRAVTFRYRGAEGAAEKVFRFDPNGLLAAEMSVSGVKDWGVFVGPGLRNPTAKELASRFERRAAVYRLDADVETVDPQRTSEAKAVPATGLHWVGLEDNYFLTAILLPRPDEVRGAVFRPLMIIPPEKGGEESFAPLPPPEKISKEEKDLARDFALVVEARGDRLSLVSYWGAKQYERLAALPGGLEKTIRLGIFRLIAVPLLRGLHWLYENAVHNYGWAIVLMTFLIKLVLLPITHKSYVSMRKMQQLNPKMQEIRGKYRGKLKDGKGRPNLEAQRKMNEEVMALYKSEGVNPAGGCLPMLLQMPVLFAFYYILGSAVELRNAPWILWIHDLSGPDPYYALPLIMGGTQFLQQRMTPAAGDPMQRRIFQLMPFFMTFLFLRFPSGLVLYWLTNNVLTIAQQWTYNRFLSPEAAAARADGQKAGGTKRARSSSAK